MATKTPMIWLEGKGGSEVWRLLMAFGNFVTHDEAGHVGYGLLLSRCVTTPSKIQGTKFYRNQTPKYGSSHVALLPKWSFYAFDSLLHSTLSCYSIHAVGQCNRNFGQTTESLSSLKQLYSFLKQILVFFNFWMFFTANCTLMILN